MVESSGEIAAQALPVSPMIMPATRPQMGGMFAGHVFDFDEITKFLKGFRPALDVAFRGEPGAALDEPLIAMVATSCNYSIHTLHLLQEAIYRMHLTMPYKYPQGRMIRQQPGRPTDKYTCLALFG